VFETVALTRPALAITFLSTAEELSIFIIESDVAIHIVISVAFSSVTCRDFVPMLPPQSGDGGRLAGGRVLGAFAHLRAKRRELLLVISLF
jgi:hypothetical protein